MSSKPLAVQLPQIIKRIELIKNLIALQEEVESISDQIIKLQQLEISEPVKEIIDY